MLTKNFNKNQYLAVNHGDGPLLITAGAGSGKTRVLTGRIIKLLEDGISPGNILAITFTNKASKEMRDRVLSYLKSNNSKFKTLNPKFNISTFHSFGALILRKEARYWLRMPNFTIYDSNDSQSLLKKVIKKHNLPKDKAKVAKFNYLIGKAKSELIDIDDELAKKIFDDYEMSLRRSNAFDFDDLIEKPVRLFQEQPGILKKYQKKYQYVLIDEFQDTNTVQYLLAKLLAREHKNINVVGDDAQSIYGWRHANFRNIIDFDKEWPGIKITALEENYRSSANIISVANQLIKNNKEQRPKNLWTKNNPGEKVKIISVENEIEEADWIAERIKEMRYSSSQAKSRNLISDSNKNINDTAILYRTNVQSRALEQVLLQYGIPYQIFGGIKFYERKEIKDIIAGLRFASNPQDEASTERLEKNFSKKKRLYLMEELPRLAKKLTPAELINFIINNTNYVEYLEGNFRNADERWDNIKELINFASSANSLEQLLETASLAQSQDTSSLKRKAELRNRNNPISLMTIHMAKGLEFDRVFIAGCNESVIPHQRSLSNKKELEEERRLMYVAMTRARKQLFLSFYNMPSRFLHELPSASVEFEDVSSQQSSSRQEQLLDEFDEERTWIEYD